MGSVGKVGSVGRKVCPARDSPQITSWARWVSGPRPKSKPKGPSCLVCFGTFTPSPAKPTLRFFVLLLLNFFLGSEDSIFYCFCYFGCFWGGLEGFYLSYYYFFWFRYWDIERWWAQIDCLWRCCGRLGDPLTRDRRPTMPLLKLAQPAR